MASDSLGNKVTNTVLNTVSTALTPVYDNNGNLLELGNRFFDYDEENRLTRVTVEGTGRSDFVYDALGRRRKAREYGWENQGRSALASEAILSILRNNANGWVGLRLVVAMFALDLLLTD